MAKQLFSVGQVLTAAQMNSLQQTAMLGGSATAKTASYTLVAADAGTVVSVNSTSATTITVNTALFSAGDTVTIQNWGSGTVTITAGTATVNTAGSLIVPQYDGGVLYFTSASAAIYFDFVQAGAVSPLTTKGDLYGFGTSDARIPIGANNTILTADSGETLGLKWATPASGGGMTLLNSGGTALSGSGTTVSFTSTGYTNLQIQIKAASINATANGWHMRLNSDTAGNYSSMRYMNYDSGTNLNSNSSGDTEIIIANRLGNVSTYNQTGNAAINIYRPTDTDFQFITWDSSGYNSNLSNAWYVKGSGYYNCSAAISSVTFTADSGSWNAGTIYVYGVK